LFSSPFSALAKRLRRPETIRSAQRGSDCSASYRPTVNDPFTTIEQADAVSGLLVARNSERGVIAGSLDFTGPLVAGETHEGDLTGSATFDAEPIAAGGRSFHVSPRPLDAAVRSETRPPVRR